jgi:hypothetical protein
MEDDGVYKNEKYKKFKRPEKRGNLFLDARYEINDYWVANLDFNYVSDVFYLKDMNLPGDDAPWLTSKLSFERFEGRNYASIEGYYYKLTSYILKERNNEEYRNRMKSMPTVAPFIEYENISDVNKRNELSIKTIDFNELKPGKNTITIDLKMLTSIHFIDEVGEITVIVTVNKEKYDERTFEFVDAF